MNNIFSENVLDLVDMTAYCTRAAPRGLRMSRAQQPSPRAAPRCLSHCAADGLGWREVLKRYCASEASAL
jgi:hypothetical protein